ncbi:MAG: DUF1638 domain-containing protein [Eubacteriales bacterium]|nr:DUF1638 domain-containing protein [Eubacteriales bacterium]
MKTALIGCRTLESEISAAAGLTGWDGPVYWLKSGLHDKTDILHETAQKLIDSCQKYDRILLAMGICGNSVMGLRTDHAELIFPRVDDCITLLCGSRDKRAQYYRSYFFTEGWLRGERTIWHEYQYTVKKYGEDTAKLVFDTMLRHYRSCIFLDTHCGDTKACAETVRHIADHLQLGYEKIDGTLQYLCTLLSGPWHSDDFVIIPPHTTVANKHFNV